MADEKENRLFRKEALESLDAPEELSADIKVTSPSVYVIVATLLVILAAVFVWGIFGSISDKTTVSGVVFPVDGVQDVSLPNRGVVRSLFVHNGDKVTAGQSLAMVSVSDSYSMISAPSSGIVLKIVNENEDFEAFEPVATIISEDENAVHSIVAFVPFELSRELRPGMEVEATPKNLTREKDGYVSGRIMEVAKYPVTREEAGRRMKTDTFADDVFPENGTAFEVKMMLNTLEDGSLDWSFEPEEHTDMTTGTYCNIQIITKKRSVYRYMFESVRTRARKIKMAFE